MPKSVQEIMKRDVVTIAPDTPLPEIERAFLSARVGGLPVVASDRRLEGIVSRSDVVRQSSVEQSLAEISTSEFDAELGGSERQGSLDAISAAVGRRLASLRARDLMIRDIETATPSEPLAEAARRMVARRIHRLPVVEDGKLVGIVSAFDFLTLYAHDER